jgi:two-component system response regulator NreC
MNKLTLLIADESALLRAGLRLLINAQEDMHVVAEAADSATAVVKASDHQPNVVVMDFLMPGGTTCRSIQAIRQSSPDTRVIVLSMYDDPAHLVAVMTAGASGYVLKRSTDMDLLSAIRAVQRGETFIDSRLVCNAIQRTVLKRAAAHAAQPGKSQHILSFRERQVLKLVADGYTNQEVAKQLALSVKTIETHRSRLMRKLGLTSRAELYRYARESGVQNDGSNSIA